MTSKPHSEPHELPVSEELRMGAAGLPQHGGAAPMMRRWADRVENLEEQVQTLQRERDEAVEDALRLGAFSGKDEVVSELERLKEQVQAAQYEGFSAEHWHGEYVAACKSLTKRVHQGAEAVRRERELKEQLESLRAAVKKELDYMGGFPGVEDGSPLALVMESLRLALGSSPATNAGDAA